MFDPSASYHAGAVQQGRVRIIGIMQQARSSALPDVPSFGEFGLPAAAQMHSWNGACVRAGRPPAAVVALHAAITASLSSAEVRQSLAALGIEPAPSESPAAAQAYYLVGGGALGAAAADVLSLRRARAAAAGWPARAGCCSAAA
jgi:tripartite-type tricarboxylate transporter receptor subunit TctC